MTEAELHNKIQYRIQDLICKAEIKGQKGMISEALADYQAVLLQEQIERSQSELIDQLLTQMPKEWYGPYDVPPTSKWVRVMSGTKKKSIQSRVDGFNQALSEVKSILLKAKEGK